MYLNQEVDKGQGGGPRKTPANDRRNCFFYKL
jgi:hypothetical protein